MADYYRITGLFYIISDVTPHLFKGPDCFHSGMVGV